MRELVFIVDADTGVRRLARGVLERGGYEVRDFGSPPALEDVVACKPAVVLVAASLPAENWLVLCRQIRQNASLSATRIALLLDGNVRNVCDTSAHDCIRKPLNPGELVARVKSLLRAPESSPAALSSESTDILIDRASMKLSVNGNEVTTTSLEFRLVDYLAQHQGRVCTRDMLLDAVWGDLQFVTPRSVDACIRRLRNKIEPDRARPTYVKTVRGVGYRFDASAAWPVSNEGCTCRACSPSLERYG